MPMNTIPPQPHPHAYTYLLELAPGSNLAFSGDRENVEGGRRVCRRGLRREGSIG